MQPKCEECQQDFEMPPGWGLPATCPDCFEKVLDNFIENVENDPAIDVTVHRGQSRQQRKLASVLDALNSEDEGTRIYGSIRAHRNLHACDNCDHQVFLPITEQAPIRKCEKCGETAIFTRLEQ